MFCGKCGKDIPPNCEFCMNCGNKLKISDTEENSNKNAKIPKYKNKKGIIIVCIVLLSVIAWLLISVFSNSDYMRGTNWGDSMESVENTENIELELRETSAEDEQRAKELAELLDKPYIKSERLQGSIDTFEMFDESNELFLTYRFEQDKLISISIAVINPGKEMEELVEKYTDKYGNTIDETGYSYTWEDKKSEIEISVLTDEIMMVTFTDINYEN